MPASDDRYDGVPYEDLTFDEVDWSDAVEHIRDRGGRKDRPRELDIEPEWATEALADPRRLVGGQPVRVDRESTWLVTERAVTAIQWPRQAAEGHRRTEGSSARWSVVGSHHDGGQRHRPAALQ